MSGRIVRTCVITGYGINADRELEEAFRRAGSETERVHVSDLLETEDGLRRYDILAFPGGFSFGDHLGSGKVLAYLVKSRLKDALDRFIAEGKLVLGICNGFQTLVKMGILPNLSGAWKQEVSLIHNEAGVFDDRWVKVRYNRKNPSPWLAGLDRTSYPIRHGEGRFIAASPEVSAELERRNLVALRYDGSNPNGSEADIAGITDATGRILGMMPHPEAFLENFNHPRWTREDVRDVSGLALFENAVSHSRNR